jgi:hypothetical protein
MPSFMEETCHQPFLKMKTANKTGSHPAPRGFFLIIALFYLQIIISFLIFSGRLLISDLRQGRSFSRRQVAFYAAEAGAARAEFLFKHDPTWQPTDPPYSGSAGGLISWLVKNSGQGGSLGLTEPFGPGGYKIVREQDKDHFYALGFHGSGPSPGPPCILKITFSNAGMFQKIKLEEI